MPGTVRPAALVAILILCWTVSGCRPGGRAPSYIDLLHQFPSAQKRSQFAPGEAFALFDAEVGGVVKSSLRTCGASRIIWSIRVPRNAVLRTAIAPAAGSGTTAPAITFRIGISDRRHYEMLFEREFPGAGPGTPNSWRPVTISLSGYAGWQWSLFYRPWQIVWDLVFTAGGPGCGYWAEPRIQVAA